MAWLSWLRVREVGAPGGKRPRWLAVAYVVFTVGGALAAIAGEGADRIWGVISVAFFGAGGVVVYAPRRGSGPGVAVERVGGRGGHWAVSFGFDMRRHLVRQVGALAMAFAGLLMAVFASDLAAEGGSRGYAGVLRVAGTAVAVTFGGFALLALAQRRTIPRLLLLQEGVALEGVGRGIFVPWTAVTDVVVVSVYRNEMIGIVVDDPRRIEAGRVTRLFLPLNRRMTRADVTIQLDVFVADPQVVVDAVRRFAADPEARRRLRTGDFDAAELLHPGPGGP